MNTGISNNEFCVPSFAVCVRLFRFLQHMPSLTTLSFALRKAYTSFVTSATDGKQSLFRLPNTDYGSMVKTQIDFSSTNTTKT